MLKALNPGRRLFYRRRGIGPGRRGNVRFEDGGRVGRGRAVERQPVVERVGGQVFTRGARDEGDNHGAEKPDGVGLELLFERVEEGLLVTLLAEHTVECRERLGASA